MITLKSIDNDAYNLYRHNVKSGIPFQATGHTALLRLFLAIKAGEFSGKKILFITSTEQNALKYKNDLKRAFDFDSDIKI